MSCIDSVLQKRGDGKGSLFPEQIYPSASVTGMPAGVAVRNDDTDLNLCEL